MKRRRFLGMVGGSLAAACSSSSTDATSPSCATPSSSHEGLYCLVEGLQVRVIDGANLTVGQAMVVNVDDATAVVLCRDEGGFFARSAICTHACCVVSLCGDDACTVLGPTPPACGQGQAVAARFALCPCHGSTFLLDDGSALTGPATRALPGYATQLEGNDVLIDTGSSVDPSARQSA